MAKRKLWARITDWLILLIALLIIFGSHITMLVYGLSQETVIDHAVLNIFAGILIVIHIIIMTCSRK